VPLEAGRDAQKIGNGVDIDIAWGMGMRIGEWNDQPNKFPSVAWPVL
jgi:hypothetical protein